MKDSLETRHITDESQGGTAPAEGLETRRIGSGSAPASDDKSTRQIAGPPATPPTTAPAAEATRPITPPPTTTPTEGTLPRGTVLQGRYQILGILGMGGMSSVYKARDLRFPEVEKLCAIKEMINLAPDPQIRATMIRNFEREANILATLNHPAVPKVYDYFTEGDRSYLVLEFIEGQDLEEVLSEVPEGEFLPEKQVLEWAIQLCDVLIYLHGHKPQPIVFRDLKPSNIMLDSHGRIRLIDFGIAKVFQSGQKGTMIGTEGYSPPEQYRGSAEPRGDIYALGATLHHLLTKQDPRLEPPFSFQERPVRQANPSVSPEFEAVIMKALEYDAEKRYGSAEEMKHALLGVGRRIGYRRPGAGPAAGVVLTGETDLEASETMALWRFACEDEVRSSPTVADGILYIGSYDHNLYALDAETGEFLWKYATEGGIASSPYVSEGKVLVGSQDRVLYAIHARTGRIEWTCPTQGRIYSSPRVEFNHVFFGSDDHHMYAASLQTGRVAWKVDMGAPIRSSAAIAEGQLFFGCEDGSVASLDIRGEMRWRFRAKRAVTSSPALDQEEGLLFVGSMDWNIYALDARSGWAVWRFRTSGPIVSSPAIHQGVVYVGSADGHLYALDARNGRVLWKYQTEGQVTSSPAYYNGAVYFGGVDGCIYSLDAETGDLRWRVKTGGPVTSSPCVVNEVVYIGSTDRYVYALPA